MGRRRAAPSRTSRRWPYGCAATGVKGTSSSTAGPFEWDGALDPAKHPNAGNFLRWWEGSTFQGSASPPGSGRPSRTVSTSTIPPPATGARGREAHHGSRLRRGIHYNFEPIGDGDADFLELLDRTRRADQAAVVSTPQIEPYPLMRLAARATLGHDKYWSHGFFRQVAQPYRPGGGHDLRLLPA
ncbi:hypothetical protein [Nonomuraea dietziae]|uniref:hypothetical protein n=1 Tax=Nonomuraea dietziae TaxID=65515 RepID=UPI0031DF6F74